MPASVETESEASLAPKSGSRVSEESCTLQVFLAGHDLALMKRLGGSPRKALEDAITLYISTNAGTQAPPGLNVALLAQQERQARQAAAR